MDLDEEDETFDEEDEGGVQMVEEIVGQMVIADTNDIEEIEAGQLDEGFYLPPSQEVPKVIKRMGG